jgi:preprotein translocase subunit SecE
MPVNLKNIVDSIVRFYGEVKAEAKKIAWPLRKETIASTTVVVVIVLIVSFYLGVVDAILSRAVKLILS